MAAYGVQESDDIYDKPKDVLEDDGFNLPLSFYYEALNSERNMFASDGIGAMVAYESALLGVEGWCRHLHSVPHPHPPAADRLSLSLSPAPASVLPLPLPLPLSHSPQSRPSACSLPTHTPATSPAASHPSNAPPHLLSTACLSLPPPPPVYRTKHCRNATSSFGPKAGEMRCASPQTVLRFLYLNAAAHKEP